MPTNKYGDKKEHEPDIVQSVEKGVPSQVTDAAFIVATYNGKRKMKRDSGRVGKWLFFVSEKCIDNTWQNVKKAIEDGKLWKVAKVSTSWRSNKDGIYVICIYTYDYNDEKDVMKIRDYLRLMGFKRSVSYKTDEQTMAGIYSDNVEGIAKYKA